MCVFEFVCIYTEKAYRFNHLQDTHSLVSMLGGVSEHHQQLHLSNAHAQRAKSKVKVNQQQLLREKGRERGGDLVGVHKSRNPAKIQVL